MKKTLLLLTVALAVLLTGCKDVRVYKPLDKKADAEKNATLLIPHGAYVKHIGEKKKGWLMAWTPYWATTATVPVPAGEQTIISNYTNYQEAWTVDRLELKTTLRAGRMYMLSFVEPEDFSAKKNPSGFNVGASFFGEQINLMIAFLKFLPREQLEGVSFQIKEINQETFDQYVADNKPLLKKEMSQRIWFGIIWVVVVFVAMRLLFYFLFMGKFMCRHQILCNLFCFVVWIAAFVLWNYNAGGAFSYYLIASIMMGIACGGTDNGAARNNDGLTKLNRGDFDGAYNDFNAAVGASPLHAVYYFNRGVAAANIPSRVNSAPNDFAKAVQLNPKMQAQLDALVRQAQAAQDNSISQG